jgi:electron transfer flavoprotein alpha subunit
MMAAGILVWSERQTVVLELLGKAHQVADYAGCEVFVCTLGEVGMAERQVFAAHGADAICAIAANVADSARWADMLGAAITHFEPGVVLIGGTKMGMDVAPRVAERTGAAYAAWAVEIEIDRTSDEASASCMLYGGAGLAKYRFTRSMTLLTVAPGAFEAKELEGRSARVETLAIPAGVSGVTVLGDRPKVKDGARLEDAPAVVDIGQGVKELKDLEMVRGLAGLLNAQLGCSRPVSSDRDWLPEWLGLSGAKVKPQLCLTIGISGAIQHMVGIRESRVIAAVNNDENAAIFMQADIGIVADLYDFLPILTERLQARGVRPVWT